MKKIADIKLTIWSPVSIGNDKAETLSPYTDFVINEEGDKVIYIDHNILESALYRQNKVERFASLIGEKIDNNRSEFRLREFITRELGYDLEEIKARELPNFGILDGEKQQVTATLHSAGRPYVSGSTLKGAIRTAILFDWLSHSPDGKKELADAFRQVKKNLWKVDDLAALRDMKRKKRLPQREFQDMKRFSRDLKQVVNKMLNEQRLFGKLKDRHEVLMSEFIQVTDTHPFDPDALAVFQAERFRLKPQGKFKKRKSKDIPQPREALQKGKSSSFTLRVDERISHSKEETLANIWKKHPDNLLDLIRRWSLACVDLECYHLSEAYDMPNRAARARMIDFYSDLYDKMKEEKRVFLRIGLGKTYYENSLGLALLDYADEVLKDEDDDSYPPVPFREFRKMALEIGFMADLFPVTRTLSSQGHTPMGWVELTS